MKIITPAPAPVDLEVVGALGGVAVELEPVHHSHTSGGEDAAAAGHPADLVGYRDKWPGDVENNIVVIEVAPVRQILEAELHHIGIVPVWKPTK